MPCKGCQSSNPGKTRCVVCETKWCDSCLGKYAEKRASGWKCNGRIGTACVGTASKKPEPVDYMTKRREEAIIKYGLQHHSPHERNRILEEEGY